MPAALVICGASNSGKTTLIEALIRALAAEGLRVGTVKADGHGKAEKAVEGKDTTRHVRAGARRSVLVSPGLASTYEQPTLQHVHAVEERFADCDFVLLEGFKESRLPKNEVVRRETGTEPLVDRKELIGVYGDVPVEGLRHFPSVESLVSFITGELMASGGQPPAVALRVNGKRIPLKPHLQEILAGAIAGTIGSLKGCEDGDVIEVVVRRARKPAE